MQSRAKLWCAPAVIRLRFRCVNHETRIDARKIARAAGGVQVKGGATWRGRTGARTTALGGFLGADVRERGVEHHVFLQRGAAEFDIGFVDAHIGFDSAAVNRIA
jgi:hypothetical protein